MTRQRRRIVMTSHSVHRFRQRSGGSCTTQRAIRRSMVRLVLTGIEYGPSYRLRDGSRKLYLLSDERINPQQVVFVCIEKARHFVIKTVLTIGQAKASFSRRMKAG